MRKRTREIDAESFGELRRAAHASGNSAVAMRARAVAAFFEGHSYVQIRESFGFVPRTVSKWITRFREAGVAGLRGKTPGPHAAPRRQELLAWLPSVIHQSPRSLGLGEDRWTLRGLQELCERQTGQVHSLEAIRVALGKLVYSWKRAKHTITSPDPEYAEKRGTEAACGRSAP